MARSRTSPVLDLAVYAVVRLLICVVQALSWRQAAVLANGLAWLAYRLNRRHREVARDNLRHAFPEWTPQQHDRLIRRMYRHFCCLIMEIAHLPRKLHTSNWRRHVDLGPDPALARALLSGRPVLLVTGHFGNWEMGGYTLGLLGFRSHAIARRLDNPYLDDFLGRFRRNTGQQLLDKRLDYDKIEAVLANRGALATLADQDAGPKGQFVEFFGRPASTHKAVALLALKYEAPLLVSGMARVGEPFRYRLIAADLIDPRDYAERTDAVHAITQRFTAALEGIVRQYPEQYFWLHRRWKHEPKRKPAAAIAPS